MRTADGSHTIVFENSNLSYHSRHGALRESTHVFIETGLNFVLERKPKQLSILEMGLGTGLNLLLTCIALRGTTSRADYTAFETEPLETGMINQLNYTSEITQDETRPLFEKIHESPWNEKVQVSNELSLTKRQEDLLTATNLPLIDLIYFDAFAPSDQPELWTVEMFRKLIQHLNPNGILVTYCSKGYVRRNLTAAGFRVTKLAGPPGKREIVRAVKP